MFHRRALMLFAQLGFVLVAASLSLAADRAILSTRPYIVADANGLGEVYARCSAAGTRIYRVDEDQDELLDRYDWYCSRFPGKLYLMSAGWSKGRPNVAVYRPRNERLAGTDPREQVEFDIYFNGKHVCQVTTQQFVDVGAALKTSSEAEIRAPYVGDAIYADFTFLGYDGYYAAQRGGFGCFSFKMSNGRIVLIDLATGKINKDPYPNMTCP